MDMLWLYYGHGPVVARRWCGDGAEMIRAAGRTASEQRVNSERRGIQKQKLPLGAALFEQANKPCLFHAALGNTSLLACEVTQVVQFRTANLTILVNGDRLDERRVHREDTLNAYVAGHLANSEALLVLAAVDSDNVTTELLDTLFVTFLDTISHRHLVACLECGKLFLLACECLLSNLNQIHCLVYF